MTSADDAADLATLRTSSLTGQALTELVAARLSAPDAAPLVGRFVVEGIIGEGGSGRVLRARHALLGFPLALKMLSHAHVSSQEATRAFIREASILVQLDHPGIVRVLDAFEAHGTFFIVMPWLAGDTLRALVDAAFPFAAEQIVAMAEEALDALVALHAAGLVHRDVKPSNILIRPSGRLVLIDFGIACQQGVPAMARRFVGSPSYSSPEQILGRAVDGRSDVYSLGCTLYELVYGQPPFGANGVEEAIEAHLHDTPSFDLPPRIAMSDKFLRWLERCLSRTRARRPDAATAREALRAIAPAAPVGRAAPRARVTVPRPVLLGSAESPEHV